MGNVEMYIKDCKIVALKLTMFYKVSKLMRPNNLTFFLKLLDYFVQPLPHTTRIFGYYVKNLEYHVKAALNKIEKNT